MARISFDGPLRTEPLQEHASRVLGETLERFADHRETEHAAGDGQRDKRKDAQADRGDRCKPRIDIGSQPPGGLLAPEHLDEHRREPARELLDELCAEAAAFGEHLLHDQLRHPWIGSEGPHVEMYQRGDTDL